MSAPRDTIREYYRRIDANDTEWVLQLFSADARYDRAEATYQGAEELTDFFRVRRQIRGVHSVESVWSVEPHIVIALGRFDGVGAKGDARSVRFVDIWSFESLDRVGHRQTFLALGQSYVRD